MRNGKSHIVRALFLAAAIAAIGGCENRGSPMPLKSDAREGPSLNVRHQLDTARSRIWWLTTEGVYVHDIRTPGRRLVQLPGWLWVGSPYSCQPDIALGPRGEAIVTSNIVPTLWRIDPESLSVSVHPLALDTDTDKDVGFSGIAYSSEQKAYLAVSDIHGSLWRIDSLLSRGEKIPLSAPLRNACGVALQSQLPRKASDRFARNRSWLLSQIPLNGE